MDACGPAPWPAGPAPAPPPPAPVAPRAAPGAGRGGPGRVGRGDPSAAAPGRRNLRPARPGARGRRRGAGGLGAGAAAPGAARVPRNLQLDLAHRAARLQTAHCRPEGPAFNRGSRRIGCNQVSHQARAIQPRAHVSDRDGRYRQTTSPRRSEGQGRSPPENRPQPSAAGGQPSPAGRTRRIRLSRTTRSWPSWAFFTRYSRSLGSSGCRRTTV